MRVIIAGSRPPKEMRQSAEGLRRWYASHRGVVAQAIADSKFTDIEEVVSGKAKGFDILGEAWAAEHRVPVKSFPANWGEYGKRAGILRNAEMAQYADALIAITYGTPGTRNMIQTMRQLGKPIFVLTLPVHLQVTGTPKGARSRKAQLHHGLHEAGAHRGRPPALNG